jgi:hypothetical protein
MELAEVRKSRSLSTGSIEGLFDHALTVVEGAVDFQGGDVFAEGGELQFLYAADLAGGIEDDDVYAFYVIEAAGDGAAGVSRGGDEYGDGPGLSRTK